MTSVSSNIVAVVQNAIDYMRAYAHSRGLIRVFPDPIFSDQGHLMEPYVLINSPQGKVVDGTWQQFDPFRYIFGVSKALVVDNIDSVDTVDFCTIPLPQFIADENGIVDYLSFVIQGSRQA